ncbi:ABC transporter permease [Streptomyces sp. CHD11]|nr:ABC transporter permease [Streptomyces sp. CHD11]
MTLFGVLGLLVSTLIVGNVVSGAVVSGYRHIGVLKALGFTPNQVVAVYLTMLSVPAVVGCVLASLGVFNTVLLNTRERRRDLGMLKSIGMTPRQVVVMTVASVAGLGAVGGLLGIPLGIVAHRLVVDNVGVVDFPSYMKNVWHAPQLAAMFLAGVTIAVLGALVPARSAARMTIASVLHTEAITRQHQPLEPAPKTAVSRRFPRLTAGTGYRAVPGSSVATTRKGLCPRSSSRASSRS